MGTAISVRADYSSQDLRRLARLSIHPADLGGFFPRGAINPGEALLIRPSAP
jgi:hypothetical protein